MPDHDLPGGTPAPTAYPGTAPPSAHPSAPPSAPSAPPAGRTYSETEFRQALDQELAMRMSQTREELARSISAELSRKYGASIDDLSELPKLREWKAEHDRKQAEAEGDYQRIMASKDEEFAAKEKSYRDEKTKLLTALQDALITGKIVAAASGKAVKPDQVAHLLAPRVKLDEKTLVASVLDPQGEPRYKGGRPVTIEELVDEFLEAEQHFAVPPATLPKGSGSVGSTGGEPRSGDGDGSDLASLRTRLTEATAQAERTGNPSDILAAHHIKRQIVKAEKAGQDGHAQPG